MSLGGYADIFLRNTLASGVVPQISAILGPCAGGAVYSPAITDFVYMVRGHELHVRDRPERGEDGDPRGHRHGGPRRRRRPRRRPPAWPTSPTTARSSASQPIRDALRLHPAEQPGGSALRASATDPVRPAGRGAAGHRAGRASEALRHPRRHPPRGRRRRLLRGARATSRQHRGRASRTWAARAWGSWPTSRRCWPGVLDINSAVKGARFVRFCDAFNIPLVVFEDVPGLPARRGAGARRHHPARREAAVRLLRGDRARASRVITRKAYGGAYDVMNSKHIRGDMNLAWPTAEIAVMGPKGAVEILFRKEIAEAEDPRGRGRERGGGVPRAVRPPVHRGGPGLRRRRHRSARDPAPPDQRPRHAAQQAGRQPAEEARQHPALIGSPRPGAPGTGAVREGPGREPGRDRRPHHPRACRELGVATPVAVYSDGGPPSRPHVLAADRRRARSARPRRPRRATSRADAPPSTRPGGARAECDAVHPGYGFLAERAPFARAVEEAGLVFVGPPAAAIAAMGDKTRGAPPHDRRRRAGGARAPRSRWRTRMRPSGRREELGYPVLLKAAAGGGGKGMRVVARPGRSWRARFEAAAREAEAAFGDGSVYLEQFLDATAPHRDPGAGATPTATCCTWASGSARSSGGTRS